MRFSTAAGDTMLLTVNEYDELGRVKSVKRNGNTNLTDNYAYNVRSWITDISGKQFTENLAYQYNGNVQSMGWQTGNRQRSYTYQYDGLSRLKLATYDAAGTNEKYGTSYNYDKHGNITSLTRSGKTTATAYGIIDNLSMAYTGNQLTGVNDSGVTVNLLESNDFKKGSTALVQYVYNKNGAMIKDLNKKIAEISYNSLNLPKRLVIDGITNIYTYSADGRKLRVKQDSHTRDYAGNFIYENGSLKRILIEGGYIENGVVHFYFNDHLGNVRAVADASGATLQKNDYYPFGLPMAEVSDNEQNKQTYKYNGKEFNRKKGLNLYDYGARQMDPEIGRFTTVDRFAEKYYSLSPYQYAANNPINNLDVNGDSIWFTYDRNAENTIVGITMNLSGKILNDSNNNVNMKKAVSTISGALSKAYKGKIKGIKFSTNVMLDVANSMNDVKESDHLFVLTNKILEIRKGKIYGGANMEGGKVAFIDADYFTGPFDTTIGKYGEGARTASHEFGHLTGLKHASGPINLMRQGGLFNHISNEQLKIIHNNYYQQKLNLGRNYEINRMGKKRPNRGLLHTYIRQ